MKMALTLVFLTFMGQAQASWKKETKAVLKEYAYACKSSEVVIDQIIKNEVITGHVKGLPTEAMEKFKVVFYVRTNGWYIHPYTHYQGQEEGYSFSNLDKNGKFKIRTVRRDVPAKEMAAVLVPQAYKIKAVRWWLKPFFGFIGGVLKFQCNHTIVPGNGDFFMESL